jgi:hypothetical protein
MPSEQPPIDVRLTVTASHPPARRGEPITAGVPWPRGLLRDPGLLALRDAAQHACPLQHAVLDRWSDGSVRWLLLDWQATLHGTAEYTLTTAGTPGASFQPLITERSDGELRVKVGPGWFTFRTGHHALFRFIGSGGKSAHAYFNVTDAKEMRHEADVTSLALEEEGPLRTTVRLVGTVHARGKSLARFVMRVHCFAGLSTVRCELTIHNPRKAEHPGGLWDLGSGGSIFLRDAAVGLLHVDTNPLACQGGWLSPEPGQTALRFTSRCELYQDSSGGERWDSPNHINRHRQVPLTFRGYRVRRDAEVATGMRATPSLITQVGEFTLGVAMPAFWQNFPKSLEAEHGDVVLRLFPQQSADVHELQGGEQKTHQFYLAFGSDPVTDQPLDWCRASAQAACTPEWYCNAGVVPYQIPRTADPHPEYLKLVDAALEGPDTLATKREVIDEYGWRHFGDIYGDHEAVLHEGPTPLVSHYNNQYDPIAGFGYQFLRSGDHRWAAEMEHLARHVTDIDIYHTDLDKSAYNHGLFWHTIHYVDADTSTHRSYPKRGKVHPSGDPVPGGGPGNEQNYSSGLMLHYFLTGNRASREAAIGLAQWVLAMDDGRKTIFRWLARGDTGWASQSRSADYHGPGRGSANSIAVLLDSHRLTGDRKFLAKAEQLIRRCIHPQDNVERQNLLDAENRWFYTMFLQSLGKYLHYKEELGELDASYAYARASLLRYVRWMAEHEYPILEKPETLEYPTETWAAQDMRKCEIFNLASRYVQDAERERFRERAEFFFQYSTSTLSSMKTRTLCRPVVLMLSFGWAHAWFKKHPNAQAPEPPPVNDFGLPTVFTPQKRVALRRAKRIVLAGGLLFVAVVAALGYWLIAS